MKKDQNNLTSHDILEYIYDHLNENGNFKHESNCDSKTLKTTTKLETKTYLEYCQDLISMCNNKLYYLKQSSDQYKSVQSWWLDFAYIVVSFTFAGFGWIFYGCLSEKRKTENKVKNKFSFLYTPNLNYDKFTNQKKNTINLSDMASCIAVGVFNLLILALFICSLAFSWAVAGQAILGIITVLLGLIPIGDSIITTKKHRKIRQLKNKYEKINPPTQKIATWLSNTEIKEGLKKNLKYSGKSPNLINENGETKDSIGQGYD